MTNWGSERKECWWRLDFIENEWKIFGKIFILIRGSIDSVSWDTKISIDLKIGIFATNFDRFRRKVVRILAKMCHFNTSNRFRILFSLVYYCETKRNQFHFCRWQRKKTLRLLMLEKLSFKYKVQSNPKMKISERHFKSIWMDSSWESWNIRGRNNTGCFELFYCGSESSYTRNNQSKKSTRRKIISLSNLPVSPMKYSGRTGFSDFPQLSTGFYYNFFLRVFPTGFLPTSGFTPKRKTRWKRPSASGLLLLVIFMASCRGKVTRCRLSTESGESKDS